MPRSRRFIALTMLLVALIHAGLWASAHRRPVEALSMALPILPARELHVNVWKPVKDNTSWAFDGALAHEIDRPLTIMIWYQHTGAATMTRLVTLRAPAWPLLAAAALCMCVALTLGMQRQSRQRFP